MVRRPDPTCVAAGVVEYHVFPDIAAYKSYLDTLRSKRVDFYVLSVGPGLRFRIALAFDSFPLFDTPDLRNVDPLKGVGK